MVLRLAVLGYLVYEFTSTLSLPFGHHLPPDSMAALGSSTESATPVAPLQAHVASLRRSEVKLPHSNRRRSAASPLRSVVALHRSVTRTPLRPRLHRPLPPKRPLRHRRLHRLPRRPHRRRRLRRPLLRVLRLPLMPSSRNAGQPHTALPHHSVHMY